METHTGLSYISHYPGIGCTNGEMINCVHMDFPWLGEKERQIKSPCNNYNVDKVARRASNTENIQRWSQGGGDTQVERWKITEHLWGRRVRYCWSEHLLIFASLAAFPACDNSSITTRGAPISPCDSFHLWSRAMYMSLVPPIMESHCPDHRTSDRWKTLADWDLNARLLLYQVRKKWSFFVLEFQ